MDTCVQDLGREIKLTASWQYLFLIVYLRNATMTYICKQLQCQHGKSLLWKETLNLAEAESRHYHSLPCNCRVAKDILYWSLQILLHSYSCLQPPTCYVSQSKTQTHNIENKLSFVPDASGHNMFMTLVQHILYGNFLLQFRSRGSWSRACAWSWHVLTLIQHILSWKVPLQFNFFGYLKLSFREEWYFSSLSGPDTW